MTKKNLLLLLICILSAININAYVYEGSCGGNVSYTLDTETGVLRITGSGAMKEYKKYIDIPWDYYRSSIKTVDILNGVTSICNCAFMNCYNLTSINIPNSVTSIGPSAFSGCYSLYSISIPEGVTSIENCTFQGCKGLTSVKIPDGVTSIGGYAFHSCFGLNSITIPQNVTSIGDDAFYNCSSLTTIVIPNSVTEIGYSAFAGCTKLLDVYYYVRKSLSNDKDLFKDSGIQFATLYVPKLSVNGYKTTAPWSGFGNFYQ